jgi:hypothetical protein
VEWVRSCYRSEWYLYRDSPRATAGRYYRAPAGTPTYPGFHNLGSRNWHDRNWLSDVTLGESLTSRQRWDTGIVPPVIPLPILVGNADCIQNGEFIADAIPQDQTTNGFPITCFARPDDLIPIWQSVADIWECTNQLWFARMIEAIENGFFGQAVVEAQLRFGPGFAVNFHPAGSVFPECLTITSPAFSVAIVGATSNYLQLALEAFASLAGPQNFGLYGTNPVWFAASSNLDNQLQGDGAVPGTPLVLSGHSYGSATVHNLAVRYIQAAPGREIRCLTFGGPKPGDARMAAWLARCRQVNLANTDDFVCVLPPNPSVLAPLAAITGPALFLLWSEWEFPPTQTLQGSDGRLFVDVHPTIDTPTLLNLVLTAINQQSFFGIGTHPIPVYIDRILKRCQGVPWPAMGGLMLAPGLPVAGRLNLAVPDIRRGSVALGSRKLLGGGKVVLAGRKIKPSRIEFSGRHPSTGELVLAPMPVARGALDFSTAVGASGGIELAGQLLPAIAFELSNPKTPNGVLVLAPAPTLHGFVITPLGKATGKTFPLTLATGTITRGILIASLSSISTVGYPALTVSWGLSTFSQITAGQWTDVISGTTYYYQNLIAYLVVAGGASHAVTVTSSLSATVAGSVSAVSGFPSISISAEAANYNYDNPSSFPPTVTSGTILNSSSSHLFWSSVVAVYKSAPGVPSWSGSPLSVASNGQDVAFSAGGAFCEHSEAYAEGEIPPVSPQTFTATPGTISGWAMCVVSFY